MRNYFIVLVISLILAGCDQSPLLTQQNTETRLDTLKGKDKLEALNSQIKKAPNNPALYFNRSQFFIENNNTEGALNDIERALKLDSTNSKYHLQKGNLLYMKGQTIPARQSFEKCVEIDNKNIDGYLKLAEIYLMLEKHKQSIKYINDALKVDVHHSRAYFIKGMNYKYLGDSAKAASSFQTAIEQDNDYYEANIQLGLIYAAAHDPIALEYYNNAIRIKPESTEAIYNKSYFLQEHGNPEKAIEGYQLMLKIDPTSITAHFNLGYVKMVYFQKFEEALPHFSDAIDLNSSYYQAFTNRGVCYENLGEKQKAEKDFVKALQLRPDFTQAAKGLSRVRG